MWTETASKGIGIGKFVLLIRQNKKTNPVEVRKRNFRPLNGEMKGIL